MSAGHDLPPVDPADLEAVTRQLGREVRGVAEVAHRCPCGEPDVVRTEPRLPDGTPFPTSFYATCPKLTGALSTLESQGVMREMSERLEHDEALRAAYAAAHVDYLERRAQLGDVLVAHSLGAGPGVNPLGDEALAMLPQWWQRHPCSADAPGSAAAQGEASA